MSLGGLTQEERALALLLDELAANAWPAPVQQQLEGWRIRAGAGVTRRANSVLTAGPTPQYADWLALTEDFYVRRGLPPRFQVSDATPEGVGDLLGRSGYLVDAPTMVMVGLCCHLAGAASQSWEGGVTTDATLSEAWLDAYMALEGYEEWKREVYRAVFSGIGPEACFVSARSDDGHVEGVALGVTERGWTGVFGVVVAEAMRRHGLATRLMQEVARWSRARGAERIYLQVMGDNSGAVRLYERLGFRRLYGYHYMVKAASKS